MPGKKREPSLSNRELHALLSAANEVEAGGFEEPPWDESEAACEALMSAIHMLRAYCADEN